MQFIISSAKAADTAGEASSVATTGEYVAPTGEQVLMENLLILALLFFVFYFMLIRPQQRRLKNHQELIKGLTKGKKVITAGGIIGTIAKFEGDDVVVVEIAPDTKVRVARSSISDVVDPTKNTANDN